LGDIRTGSFAADWRPVHTLSRPARLVVGRDDKIGQALAVLDANAKLTLAPFNDNGKFKGIVLQGDCGTSESTLTRALAVAVESRGLTAWFVQSTEAGSAVPLRAFCWLSRLDPINESVETLAAEQRTLEQEKNLVLVVDDIQWLNFIKTLICDDSRQLIWDFRLYPRVKLHGSPDTQGG
jgi:hypothetical protein